MKDMLSMMKQAMDMQQKMQAAQAKLEGMILTGRAGGDAVAVTVNGKGAVTGVSIAPDALTDRAALEAHLVTAFNNARVQAESEAQKAMADAMGPLAGLGGMGGNSALLE